MLARLRSLLIKAVTTPPPGRIAESGGPARRAAFAVAVVLGLWLLAYKIRDFQGLGTTSDLYMFVQMSTVWPGHRFYQDNYDVNALTLHTNLFSPVLWPLAQPLGAYGLFIALALAFGASFLAMERILRMFGVPWQGAVGFALAAAAMPVSAFTFQDVVYGFNLELLESVFALWLAYHLFRRAWGWATVHALALISLKEDATLLALAVAVTVLGEDWLRGWSEDRENSTASRWNWPAAAMGALAILMIPVLLYVIRIHQPAGAAVNLARLHVGGRGESPANYQELFVQVFGNLGQWLESGPVADWSRLVIPATFGLAILRPHLAFVGLSATVVAWLRNDNLLWGPRFVQALALFQLLGCLGLASLWRLVSGGRSSRRVMGGTAALGLVAALGCIWVQLRAVPGVGSFYRLRPPLTVSPADRQRADRVFATYRREGKREEPVVATTYLFRYAHDRNLFWPDYLKDRPTPIWILWDTEDRPVMALWSTLKRDAGVDLADYELRERDGRFLLLKRRTGSSPGLTLDTGIPALTGEPFGAVRLRVKLPAKQVGHTEPLLSVGRDVFQVTYLDASRIVLGVERIGFKVFRSEPIAVDPAREHEIELFSGALYPPKRFDETPAAASRRNYYEYLLSIRLDQREALRMFLPQRGAFSGEVAVGINQAKSGSADFAFTGLIRSADRGGFPAMPGSPDADVGALRMRVVLPAAAAGTPEPLLVTGEPGAALLAFVRVLPHGRIRLGVEQWGVGVRESDELVADSRWPIEVTFEWPELFPPLHDGRWGATSAARQEQAHSQIRVMVDGQPVLTWPKERRELRSAPLYFGENPLGGSLVGSAFTGEILWKLREPVNGR